MPGLLLGDVFPDFEAESTTGIIKLHEFLGDSWGILFSHPRDYTPVCTTELGRAARLSSEFSQRGVKMIALSVDCLEDHHGWTKDILAYNCEDPASSSLPFPIIADCKRELAVALGMLDPDEKDKDGMPLTARCVSLHNKNLILSFKGLSILSILMPTESDYYPSQTPPLRLSVCLCGCVFRCLSSGPTKGSNCRSSTRPPPDATLTRSCEWWTPSSSQLGNEWPHLPTGRYVTCWRQSSSIET
uniref:Peroxiredoxin 6 n=1 Tax=Sparus aurata TaxID=8175 RepID=A0A671WB07_SPAAU